jgi:hypothetical protein
VPWADVAIHWEVLFSGGTARTVALSIHGIKVVVIVERLNVVEIDSRR